MLYDPLRLPPRLRDAVVDPETTLVVSHASFWEIGAKAARGRLEIAGDSVVAIFEEIHALRTELLPIEEGDILASVSLPFHHADPFDRMLIAQARTHGLPFATTDSKIKPYDVSIYWE